MGPRGRLSGSSGRSAAGAMTLVLSLGGVALAAQPRANAKYRGTGGDYMNNAPHWAREAKAKVSFRTSADRKRILGFRGSYSYYCGAGTSYVTAKYIDVSKAGRFGYDFTSPVRAPDGAIDGTDYVAISGHFMANGSKAKVSYLVDAVSTAGSKPVRHPYSTKQPHALGCASWVRATVKAH